MKKQELIEEIKEILDLSTIETKSIVNLILDKMINGIIEDGELYISPLGKFEIKTKKQKKGNNMYTGESITIPEKLYIKYKPSINIKNKLEE